MAYLQAYLANDVNHPMRSPIARAWLDHGFNNCPIVSGESLQLHAAIRQRYRNKVVVCCETDTRKVQGWSMRVWM